MNYPKVYDQDTGRSDAIALLRLDEELLPRWSGHMTWRDFMAYVELGAKVGISGSRAVVAIDIIEDKGLRLA